MGARSRRGHAAGRRSARSARRRAIPPPRPTRILITRELTFILIGIERAYSIVLRTAGKIRSVIGIPLAFENAPRESLPSLAWLPPITLIVNIRYKTLDTVYAILLGLKRRKVQILG
jgi:hypothetical protein